MAVRLRPFAVAVLITFLSLERATGDQCYNCDSLQVPDCGIPFNPDKVSKCGGSHCEKVTTMSKETTRVTRSCLTGPKDTSCTTTNNDSSNTTMCYCKGSYCNGESNSGDNSSAFSLQQKVGMYSLLATSAAVVLLARLKG